MKNYDSNKIFVEGKSDKRFIDFLLLKFYEIIDIELVIDVKGKDKLKNNPLLINEKRKNEGAKNLIIFDTDFENNNSKGGKNVRYSEYETVCKELNILFEIYLLPFNDEREGILENMLNTCFKDEFSFFDNCWNQMIDCIKIENNISLNIPAQKAFIYSKFDLFKQKREIENWDYKSSSKYEYQDSGIWEFNRDKNKELDKLLKFIEDNLFNN